MPVDDGHLLLAGPGAEPVVLDAAGRVPGVALGGDGRIVVATREAEGNSLSALEPG